MEVFHAGVWGTICHNHWNVDNANVVCRELGYARSISFPGFSTFPGGSGQVGCTVKCYRVSLMMCMMARYRFG